jgi:hypothetical protein
MIAQFAHFALCFLSCACSKLEVQPNASGSSANRGVRPGQSAAGHLSSVPTQPVSDRVLALQQKIRAEAAARKAKQQQK